MKFFLMRHGIAEERRCGLDDSDRALTPKGQHRIHSIAKHLADVGISWDTLLSSPWRRARETADILIEHKLCTRYSLAPFAIPTMTSDDRLRFLCDWLECERTSHRSVVGIVGHSPILEEWVEVLLEGTDRGTIDLRKGGIVGLELAEQSSFPGKAKIFCLANPRILIGSSGKQLQSR